MSTKKQYVWSVGRISEHILYLYIFAGAVSLAILILTLLVCIAYLKGHKDNEKSSKDIADKNLYIEELTNKLQLKTETANNASICDVLTKLYNQRFFYTMLSKINIGYFQPICIVVADINGLDGLNQTAGYRAGDDLLINTARILQRLCLDTDVVARTGNSEFSILMVSTDESQAYGITDNIRRQFADLDYTDLTLSIGVAQMNIEDSDIYSVLERARKNSDLEKLNDPNSSSYNVVAMLMKMLNAYSPEAVAHCNRIKKKAVELGKALGLSNLELMRLSIAAQLHDVGKIGISDTILNKKEMLTISEKNLIRKHPQIGYEIVKLIPSLDEVAIDILQHHEYYNGTGYPSGLGGEDITLNARIINIIDSYDAMTNSRVYSRVKTPEEAIKELRDKSNIQYDPDIVNTFIEAVEII
jgi:diguanylate cyclase (GGDEF)-like protein